MKSTTKYKINFSCETGNCYSNIYAHDLLYLEKALTKHLAQISQDLSRLYSPNDKRTAREVLEEEHKKIEVAYGTYSVANNIVEK